VKRCGKVTGEGTDESNDMYGLMNPFSFAAAENDKQ